MSANKYIRSYIKIMIRGRDISSDNIEKYVNEIKKYNNLSKLKRDIMIKYLKDIIVDFNICPYCNNEYDSEHIFTDCGFELKDDGIRICCHKCAIEAGLKLT